MSVAFVLFPLPILRIANISSFSWWWIALFAFLLFCEGSKP